MTQTIFFKILRNLKKCQPQVIVKHSLYLSTCGSKSVLVCVCVREQARMCVCLSEKKHVDTFKCDTVDGYIHESIHMLIHQCISNRKHRISSSDVRKNHLFKCVCFRDYKRCTFKRVVVDNQQKKFHSLKDKPFLPTILSCMLEANLTGNILLIHCFL